MHTTQCGLTERDADAGLRQSRAGGQRGRGRPHPDGDRVNKAARSSTTCRGGQRVEEGRPTTSCSATARGRDTRLSSPAGSCARTRTAVWSGATCASDSNAPRRGLDGRKTALASSCSAAASGAAIAPRQHGARQGDGRGSEQRDSLPRTATDEAGERLIDTVVRGQHPRHDGSGVHAGCNAAGVRGAGHRTAETCTRHGTGGRANAPGRGTVQLGSGQARPRVATVAAPSGHLTLAAVVHPALASA
jgi:hypothetical protein